MLYWMFSLSDRVLCVSVHLCVCLHPCVVCPVCVITGGEVSLSEMLCVCVTLCGKVP